MEMGLSHSSQVHEIPINMLEKQIDGHKIKFRYHIFLKIHTNYMRHFEVFISRNYI